ncbi:MAG TPA: HD domain-containing phosphohydrolase [Vicinamibacterales bacterium]|nr:HD domain-containing phosphohydrolase [Vicinamibacterales bacterium]
MQQDPYRGIFAKAAAVSVALEERDPSTHQHCDRVAGLALELGVHCGLSERELGHLRIAAGFHDVGKIGIPDSILKKPMPLTEDDWVIMKSHPVRSERIMLAADIDDGGTIARAVRHHHERCDGRGYPDGLSGEDIPFLARIIAIADAYDAMARRIYAAGRTHAEIMDELRREQGRQHDAYLVERFFEIIGCSPLKTD